MLVSTVLAVPLEELDTGVSEPLQLDLNENPQTSETNDVDISDREVEPEDSFEDNMEAYEMNGNILQFIWMKYLENGQDLQAVPILFSL